MADLKKPFFDWSKNIKTALVDQGDGTWLLKVVTAGGGGGGSTQVEGRAAEGAAATGNPVRIGGWDGTNVRTIKTNTDGEILVNLETADIQIGAVEIKNATTDDRATVDTAGNVSVKQARAATATLANVSDSATSVTLQAANANRLGWSCFNDSTEALFVKFGATASATSFTVKVGAGAFYEMPVPIFTGLIDGIWNADSTGAARLTELTS